MSSQSGWEVTEVSDTTPLQREGGAPRPRLHRARLLHRAGVPAEWAARGREGDAEITDMSDLEMVHTKAVRHRKKDLNADSRTLPPSLVARAGSAAGAESGVRKAGRPPKR